MGGPSSAGRRDRFRTRPANELATRPSCRSRARRPTRIGRPGPSRSVSGQIESAPGLMLRRRRPAARSRPRCRRSSAPGRPARRTPPRVPLTSSREPSEPRSRPRARGTPGLRQPRRERPGRRSWTRRQGDATVRSAVACRSPGHGPRDPLQRDRYGAERSPGRSHRRGSSPARRRLGGYPRAGSRPTGSSGRRLRRSERRCASSPAVRVLDRRQEAGIEDLEAHLAGTKRTRSPGWTRFGRSRPRSHSRTLVRPMRCHPPGSENG